MTNRSDFPIILALLTVIVSCIIFAVGCGESQVQTPPNTPRYSAEQVIAMAKSNSEMNQPSYISWDWVAQYLPAQPDLGLKGVWWVEQSAITPTDDKVSQVWYFHEDTGKFTKSRY